MTPPWKMWVAIGYVAVVFIFLLSFIFTIPPIHLKWWTWCVWSASIVMAVLVIGIMVKLQLRYTSNYKKNDTFTNFKDANK